MSVGAGWAEVPVTSGRRDGESIQSPPQAMVVGAVCAASLVPLPGVDHLTAATIVLLLLWPVVLPPVATVQTRPLLVVATLALIAPAVGWLTGGSLDSPTIVFALVAVCSSVVVLLWATTLIDWRLALLTALPGPAIFDLVTRSGYGNIWKYALSFWVVAAVVVALAGAGRRARALGYLSLMGVSAAFETRNIVMFVLVAAVLDLVVSFSGSRMIKMVLGGLVAVGLTAISFHLAIGGTLGPELQATMLNQTSAGASGLLERARPESSGNLALITGDPLRGVSTQGLDSNEAAVVRSSIQRSGWDPTSERVTTEVLGRGELHSAVADLWLFLGSVGLLIAAVGISVATFALWQLAGSWTVFNGLAAFGAARLLWDLGFSPVSDTRAWPIYLVAIALFDAERRRNHNGSDLCDRGEKRRT